MIAFDSNRPRPDFQLLEAPPAVVIVGHFSLSARIFRSVQPKIASSRDRSPPTQLNAGSSDSVKKMAHGQTLAECFAHFGAVCASRRFSKSAVTQDGQTVVVAMWEDEVQRDGERVVYQSRYTPRLKGKVRGVDSELIANLKWARDHCFGLVRVVMLAAEDVTAEPRKIVGCYPDDSLVMRVTGFDSHSRTFRAESV